MNERFALVFVVSLLPLIAPTLAMAEPNATTEPERLPRFDQLWDYSHPGVTEQKFRELLPAAEKSGDLSYLLQLETQIARCQGLQGRFDDCKATLDAVERRLTDGVPVARIRYLLERGRALNSSGSPERAKPLFLSALQLADATKETSYAIDAAHMVAIVETDPAAQVDWNRKALARAEADPQQHRWLPSIYNNLGEAYRASKKYDEALNCFELQAKYFRDRGRKPDIFNSKDIPRLNRLLGRPEIALATIEPIAKDLQSKQQPDGYISAEYGQCLAAIGRKGEAKPFLVEAFEILSKDDYMLRYEPDELQHIKQLAEIED